MRYEPEHFEFDFYYFEKYGIDHNQVKMFSEANYNHFLSLCRDDAGQLCMTSSMNTEWVVRTYCAAKMVMSATLLLNSAEYCIHKNIMISVPYLLYYAAFSSARALLYVSPFHQAKSLDGIMTITHSKVLNISSDIIRNHLDPELGEKVKDFLNYLKNQRELFSYRFPATGIQESIKFEETVDLCGLLAELAELASRQIQKVYEKKFLDDSRNTGENRAEWMSFDAETIKKAYDYSDLADGNDSIPWIDPEDLYRIGYIERKIKYPASVLYTMTEGMTEDFFGAWCGSEHGDEGEQFDPDKNWNRIFPIP